MPSPLRIAAVSSGLRVVFEAAQLLIRRNRRSSENVSSSKAPCHPPPPLSETIKDIGLNAARFGLFVGSYAFSTKYLSSVFARLRNKHDTFNQALAAFFAALTIFFEKQDWVRVYLAQYLIVRAFESMYNDHKSKGKFLSFLSRIPQVHILLFLFVSGQAMYSYVMRPTAIPPTYYKFIRASGPVHENALQATRDNERGIPINIKFLNEWYNSYHEQRESSSSQKKEPTDLFTTSTPVMIPCLLYHPQTSSCIQATINAFFGAARKTALMYFLLTTIPMALRAGLGNVMRNPLPLLKAACTSAATHTFFLSLFVGSFQAGACMYDQLYRLGYAPAKLRARFWGIGVFAGLAGFVESESGVIGFNVYGLPKVGASLYTVLCEHFPSVFKKVAKGEIPMLMFACAMLTYYYQINPKVLGPNSLIIFRYLMD